MPDPVESGLRERKKERTRATLIEVAAELCLRDGFDNTTVERIAAAADVSSRTFSRYFVSKDAVVRAIAEEVEGYLAAALDVQPPGITDYEAILRAHIAVFGPEKPYLTPGFRRMAVMIQIVNSSTSIRLFQQHGPVENVATAALGRRMGRPTDHPAVRMVTDIWTLVFTTSFAGLGLPGHDPIDPGIVCERMCATFEVFRRTWAPRQERRAPDQPPQARR